MEEAREYSQASLSGTKYKESNINYTVKNRNKIQSEFWALFDRILGLEQQCPIGFPC